MFFPARPSLVHGSVQSAECPSLSTILPPSMAIIVRPLPPQPYRQHPPPIRGDNRAVFLHQPLIVSMCPESSRPLTRIRPVSSGPYSVSSLMMPDFPLPLLPTMAYFLPSPKVRSVPSMEKPLPLSCPTCSRRISRISPQSASFPSLSNKNLVHK